MWQHGVSPGTVRRSGWPADGNRHHHPLLCQLMSDEPADSHAARRRGEARSGDAQSASRNSAPGQRSRSGRPGPANNQRGACTNTDSTIENLMQLKKTRVCRGDQPVGPDRLGALPARSGQPILLDEAALSGGEYAAAESRSDYGPQLHGSPGRSARRHIHAPPGPNCHTAHVRRGDSLGMAGTFNGGFRG